MADMETRGWQPIETAPRDGTPVLLWDDRARMIGPCGAWAAGSRKGVPAVIVAVWNGYHWDSDLVELEGGWESTGTYTVGVSINPTHWMPLPQPPEAEK